jgi:hypothetical protein
MLSVLDLGYSSPRLPTCTPDPSPAGCTSGPKTVAGDIQFVGAGATRDIGGSKANGWLWFGMSTYGNWATVGNTTVPYVDIDTDADGTPDFEVFVQNEPSTDLLMALVVELSTGQLVGLAPANFAFGDVDTNVFDTNTLLIPVSPAAIGLTDADSTFPITYSTGTNSAFGSAELNGDIDQTPAVSFDVANPRVQVSSPLFYDGGGVGIAYRLGTNPAMSADQAAANAAPADLLAGRSGQSSTTPATALILHLHGKSGTRAEVLALGG